MLKKMIISVLILALCFAFVSCDSQPADQSTPSTNESTKEESQAEENNNQTEESKNDIVKDTIPPAFIDANDGVLPAVIQIALIVWLYK